MGLQVDKTAEVSSSCLIMNACSVIIRKCASLKSNYTVELVVRLETEASFVEESSSNALNVSKEAHATVKRVIDSTSQVTDDIRLLEQRYAVDCDVYSTPPLMSKRTIRIPDERRGVAAFY